MTRYIDTNEAIKQLSPYARWGDDGREVIGFSEVKTILSIYSKADVVPKSEVEKAKQEVIEEIDRMCIDTFGNFNHQKFIELKKKYIGEVTENE